jgi:RecA/RadA recombinase
MSVNIIGTYPTIPRKRTGLFSFDRAVGHKGEFGLPLRTVVELYGYPNVGKSSLSYFLSGRIAETGRIEICDLEMLDRDYLQAAIGHSGFSGDVRIMDITDKDGKPITHEKMMMAMVGGLYDEGSGSAILDSVGAIQPIAESEGDFGEAFMGKRAKLVAQVSRALSSTLRTKTRPSAAFVINHVHSIIGGRGHSTAGGETLKYIAAVRIMLTPVATWRLKDDDPTSPLLGFQVKGQIEKLRYGGRGEAFSFFIVPGYGVHQGVSAMFDCFTYKLAEQGSTVKLDGKSLGYIRKDLLTYAAKGKERKFDPFVEKLQEYEKDLAKERKDADKEDDTPKKRKSSANVANLEEDVMEEKDE